MRSLAVDAPRQAAERIRIRLLESGRLRHDVGIDRDGERVYLPVTGRFEVTEQGARLVEHEFPRSEIPKARSYRDLLDVPKELAALLPRSFDVVGDIVLVRLPEELRPRASEIGAALLQFVPRARLVVEDRGVHGKERLRELHRLAGTGGFATEHQENGLRFEVDLSAAYFSPRLGGEHAKIAGWVREGESVLDLCCGIGPFALTIACRSPAKEVTAVDVNAQAIRLLQQNQARLRPRAPIRAIAAAAEEYLPSAPEFDRIVLNLPHEGLRLLPLVAGHLRPAGRLHFYGIGEKRERARRRTQILDALGANRSWKMEEEHRVHDYSPREELTGYTLGLSRPTE